MIPARPDTGHGSGDRVRKWAVPVGLMIGVVSIVVSVGLSISAQSRRGLLIRYLKRTPLIDTTARERGDLAISHMGGAVADPWLLSARLENSGNLPIERNHIEAPISLQFTGTRILSASVVERSPDDLSVTAEQDGSTVTMLHELLNEGDWATFDILCDGEPDWPRISLRISGVSEIQEVRPEEDRALPPVTLFAVPESLA